MKNKKLVLFLVLLSATHCFAQRSNTESQKPVIEKFTLLYNQQKFDSVYGMLSTTTKQKLGQEMFTGFLSKSLFSSYGLIKTITFITEKPPVAQYMVEFDKGPLDMMLATDPDNSISGIRFLPHKSINKDTVSWKPLITDNKRNTKLDRYTDSLVNIFCKGTKRAGLCIALVDKDGDHIYSYGETKKGNDTLPNEKTIFEIGSITKTFTAWLFSEAIERKLVHADDDIRKYLKGNYPNLEFNGKSITLMNLVNHTSGLPRIPADMEKQVNYNEADPYRNYTRQMMLDYLRTVKIDRTPGVISDYSNYGMAILGVILEDVFQSSYEKLIARYITVPLGMKDTYLTVPDSKQKGQATVYTEDGKETTHWHLGDMAACGGINSTLNDMLIYLKACSGAQSMALKRLFVTSVKINDSISVAYGWHTRKLKTGSTMIWHNGGTFGSSSFCGFIPDTKIMIVLLSNTGINCDELAIELINKLMAE